MAKVKIMLFIDSVKLIRGAGADTIAAAEIHALPAREQPGSAGYPFISLSMEIRNPEFLEEIASGQRIISMNLEIGEPV